MSVSRQCRTVRSIAAAITLMALFVAWLPTWAHPASAEASDAALGVFESAGAAELEVSVSGWAAHRDGTPGAGLHVYIDGVFAAGTTADLARPDVPAVFPELDDHAGFAVTVASHAGEHQVCAFVLGADPGDPSLALGCKIVGVPGPPPVGLLESVSSSGPTVTVSGWAGVPDQPVVHADIDLLVDGRVAASVPAADPRPDVADGHPDLDGYTGFTARLDLAPGSFPEGASTRTVMEHLGTLIVRDGPDSFLLAAARSSAKSFLHAVETSAQNVG